MHGGIFRGMANQPPKVEDEPGAEERFERAIKNALETPPEPRTSPPRTEAEVERLLVNAIRDRDGLKGKPGENHRMATMVAKGLERELLALRQGKDGVNADEAPPGST
jgi:hypothetical protein